jgi:DNA-binding transcriptional regulator YiaG
MTAAPETLRRRIALRRELPSPQVRRALREGAGVSLTEVAEAVGVSRQAISHWELGQRTPRGEYLDRYLEALRILREAGGGAP